ncbi:transposase [Streptomyces sp. BA2]|uniref:transposase n=1 Tax=Streptomyces sp. BA2 TaxID=436595 RepID=UPI00132448A8|nr:transposase [Streptomyces sp. BA2]MWA08266.1 hypothetical protein [Streptomyces sp. BA2]
MTVRRVTGWIMRRPEQLTGTERKCLDDLCDRSPALATTTEYARRLALILRERRNEHLVLEVWLADVRLEDNENSAPWPAVCAATEQPSWRHSPPPTSGAAEGNVTRIELLKRQMYGRVNFDLLRRRILLSP